MATTSTSRARSPLRQTQVFALLALLASAALAADVERLTEGVAGGDEASAAVVGAAAPEGKGKRQAVYGGPFSSLLSSAYQLPAATSGGSGAVLLSSGTQQAPAYQPLAGLGLPLGYGSASAAYAPSLLRSGLLTAASNHSYAGSPLAALLSAGFPAAQYSAQHNFTLPVAANLLAQSPSYFPGGGLYASAAPAAADYPQNFTFGQPAASSLFAQNSAAYPSFYPAPSGFRQNFNAGLFGAATTSTAFPGSVVAQGGAAPGAAGSPFTFFSYPVAAKSGQQSVATVGVSNQLLSPHQPLSLDQARRRFPQYFTGVEEPYARFQQQLQQMQQLQQQPQQPQRQPQQLQLQPPLPPQLRGPAESPKPPQVTEFPEERPASGFARPHPAPAPAAGDANDDDDDGSYDERPAYKSSGYHGAAGVDHHKIRAEQESEDEDSSERHPNSYQKIIYHGKPYHGEEESGKSSYPGYYPKAAHHKKHYAGEGEDEDSRRPQESSGEDDDEDEDRRPAYSSSYQRFPSPELDSHFNRAAAASQSSNPGGPRPAAQTLHTYRFKVPDYATETYSPVTGRPSRTKSGAQRRPHQDDEESDGGDSAAHYSSPRIRVHKTAWSYTRSLSSRR
ncbi:uncharacterized protein LOC126424863 [Schistocerca serialis cubense]|uniref:uncharacterized protein LOC126424863 n=1 Tax=Schistocerca serialis cubense TaxID=2023355 RepID=UPI00214F483D|nr:uncharacterized protein LOC126424863 [Schistocerca serialis cubense]